MVDDVILSMMMMMVVVMMRVMMIVMTFMIRPYWLQIANPHVDMAFPGQCLIPSNPQAALRIDEHREHTDLTKFHLLGGERSLGLHFSQIVNPHVGVAFSGPFFALSNPQTALRIDE